MIHIRIIPIIYQIIEIVDVFRSEPMAGIAMDSDFCNFRVQKNLGTSETMAGIAMDSDITKLVFLPAGLAKKLHLSSTACLKRWLGLRWIQTKV